MDPQIHFCTTSDNVSIAYFGRGHGLAFVVVPAMYSNVASEEDDSFALQAGIRIVSYDGRGMGSSQRDVQDFSLDARIRDLEAVVRATDLQRFVLIAEGTVSCVAIQFAHDRPDLVSHMVLESPAVDGEAAYREFPNLGGLEAMRASDAQWETYTLTAANIQLDFKDPELAQKVAARKRAAMTPEAVRRWVLATRSMNVRQLLPKITTPTLVIAVARTRTSDQIVAAEIPGATLVEVPTGARDKALAAIAQFVAPGASVPPSIQSSPVASPFRMILFTDLVGHTEMMQRLGDAKGRDVLREHERITRETLKQHAGAEIKTMGDGFMASFRSVTSAMECAIALQRAFAAWNERGQHAAPLHVRVGLNAGEPIEEDGDLFGATVIMASRVAAHADAGEILIPEPVRHLLAGKGFVFADRGETMLKGFDEAVRLYEVRWRE